MIHSDYPHKPILNSGVRSPIVLLRFVTRGGGAARDFDLGGGFQHSGNYPMVFLHSGARDFDLGGGFQHLGNYPMVFLHSEAVGSHVGSGGRGSSATPSYLPEWRCRQQPLKGLNKRQSADGSRHVAIPSRVHVQINLLCTYCTFCTYCTYCTVP